MTSEVIETRSLRTWMGEDGIMRQVALPGSEHTLDDAKENVEISAKIIKGKKVPGLVDIREVKSASREARMHYAGDENAKVLNAVAILIDSPVSRILGNFFIGLNKAPFPCKLFSSESAAIEWLREFIK